jgi:hypothetical protein
VNLSECPTYVRYRFRVVFERNIEEIGGRNKNNR